MIDRERDERLWRDPSAWERIGRTLRMCDPQRYIALLKIAEDVCAIHHDPLGPVVPSDFHVFSDKDPDQFD